jgi:hypothetical protein
MKKIFILLALLAVDTSNALSDAYYLLAAREKVASDEKIAIIYALAIIIAGGLIGLGLFLGLKKRKKEEDKN